MTAANPAAWGRVEGAAVVQHVDLQAPDLDDLGRGRLVAHTAVSTLPRTATVGATARSRSSTRRADIAGMKNQVRPVQRIHRFGAKQAMRVGNHPDRDGGPYGAIIVPWDATTCHRPSW